MDEPTNESNQNSPHKDEIDKSHTMEREKKGGSTMKTIKILEEIDKSVPTSNPPNFFNLNICFEYAEESGKLKPTKKLEN